MENIYKPGKILKVSDEEKKIISSYRVESLKEIVESSSVPSERELLIKANLMKR